MKLKDILTRKVYEEYGDMDVVDDVIDDFYPAWCGGGFTKEGYRHFAEALEIDAEIRPIWGNPGIMCHIDGPDWMHKRKLLAQLFSDLCGYCTVDESELWFTDEPSTPLEMNAGYEIIAKEKTFSDPEEGYVLGYNEKKKEYVTWAYTKRPGEETSYYWGHYIIDERAARKDYHERIASAL